MKLQPISIDEDKNNQMYTDCQEIFESYPAYYYKMGYNPPWIGYFVINDGVPFGVAGFTGEPKDNTVEVAYGTFKNFEGKGVATFACKELISIAKDALPGVRITAKTAPGENGSTTVLRRNGFHFTRIVQDEEIGDAWEWTHEDV